MKTYKRNIRKAKRFVKKNWPAIVFAITWSVVLVLGSAWVGGQYKQQELEVKSQNQAFKETLFTTEPPLYESINLVRIAHGVPALEVDPSLEETARNKAEDMARLNYFTHERPNGEPFYVAIYRTRPNSRLTGENLSKCFTSNKALVDAWVASPGHFENIIRPDFTKTGTAIVWDDDLGCLIAVNHFGR